MRKASIKETGEELSQEEWARFDRAVAEARAERRRHDLFEPFVTDGNQSAADEREKRQ